MSSHARGDSSASGGLLASLRRLGASLAEILHTRAELFAREFELERIRVARLFIYAMGALFFFALGAVMLTLLIIVLFWDSNRLLAIGSLTVLYLGAAVALALVARRQITRGVRPFAASVAALRKDREHLASHR
jgi:uncharacterized membrane protein YqjE